MEKAGQAFTETGKVGKQFTEDGKAGADLCMPGHVPFVVLQHLYRCCHCMQAWC